MKAEQCRYQLESRVKVRGKVWWRRQCKNRTTDPSGLCHAHRPHQPPEARP